MKYKVGDKIVIKNQEWAGLHDEVEAWLESLKPPRVVEINEIGEFNDREKYAIEGSHWLFDDDQVERKLLKYKLDDQVVIKTWAELRAEYNIEITDNNPPAAPRNYLPLLGTDYNFSIIQSEMLDAQGDNRVLTINICQSDHYLMKEMSWIWTDEMIKGKVGECSDLIFPEIEEMIENRFEILDL